MTYNVFGETLNLLNQPTVKWM